MQKGERGGLARARLPTSAMVYARPRLEIHIRERAALAVIGEGDVHEPHVPLHHRSSPAPGLSRTCPTVTSTSKNWARPGADMTTGSTKLTV